MSNQINDYTNGHDYTNRHFQSRQFPGQPARLSDHQNAAESGKLRAQMETAGISSISKSESAVRAAMANVYFLAKQDLPTLLLATVNNHLLYQGVSQLSDLKVDHHTSYEHSDSSRDFQESIAAVIEDELLDKVKSSGKYSLMFDESTDISVHQNLIMYIRILENDHLGVVTPKTRFFSIDSLERATAESIYTKVLGTLNKKGIQLSGLCGLSTDGASVMVGNKSGVVTRLKQAVPGVLATHCIAHRLALSCCSGADSIPYLVKVQEILNSTYKYFHFSPKHMAMLESIQQHTQGKSLKFKEVFHTRWLSFEGSVEALVRNYGDLVSVFLEESSGKALRLYKPITCYKFLYVVNFMCDVLKPLAALSRFYQKSDLDFSEVTPLLHSTVERIDSLGSKKDGACLSNFLTKVPDEPQVGEDGLTTLEYQGHTIRDSTKQRLEASSICDKFVAGMVKSLNDRFSDNDDGAVLTALSNFFNPVVDKNLKVDDVEVVVEYLGSVDKDLKVDDVEVVVEYLAVVDKNLKVDDVEVVVEYLAVVDKNLKVDDVEVVVEYLAVVDKDLKVDDVEVVVEYLAVVDKNLKVDDVEVVVEYLAVVDKNLKVDDVEVVVEYLAVVDKNLKVDDVEVVVEYLAVVDKNLKVDDVEVVVEYLAVVDKNLKVDDVEVVVEYLAVVDKNLKVDDVEVVVEYLAVVDKDLKVDDVEVVVEYLAVVDKNLKVDDVEVVVEYLAVVDKNLKVDDVEVVVEYLAVVDKNLKVDDVEVVVEYLGSVGVECNREDLDMFLGYVHALIREGNESVKAPKDVANMAIRKRDVYSAAGEAAERFLLAPVSTVDCERGFSKQNLIKTCLRSRMLVKSLDRLLRISSEGPEIGKFHFDKAFKKWALMKDRRILK